MAFRLLGERDGVEDVLQVAYLKAFRALPSLRQEEWFKTWLYRIAYNACMDELRRRGRERLTPLDETVAEREDPAPEVAETVVSRQELEAALAALPVDMRAAVLLVDAEGLTYDAAARVLGVPRGTVAARLSRARARLRRVLRPGDVDRRPVRTSSP